MRLDDHACDEIALRLADIAIEAGGLLREMQKAGVAHRLKDDGSPTTGADLAAEDLILARLQAFWPGIPAVAEETMNAAEPGDVFFLVDPLDGTRDFLHGTGEYSVNIALVRGDRPVAAVVAAPAMDRIWIAGATAREAHLEGSQGDHRVERPAERQADPREQVSGEIPWRPIQVRPAPASGLVALVSRRHGDEATEACLASLSIGTRRTASSALKFCLIASGEADVYVRCGPTMEWDTAAGDHILTRAGGCIIGPGGGVLTYGHEERGYLNGPFAALGSKGLAPRLSLPLVSAG